MFETSLSYFLIQTNIVFIICKATLDKSIFSQSVEEKGEFFLDFDMKQRDKQHHLWRFFSFDCC